MSSAQTSLESHKSDTSSIKTSLKRFIAKEPVFFISKTYCSYCRRAQALLSSLNVPQSGVEVVELDMMKNGDLVQQVVFEMTTQSTVPNVFIGGKHVGGFSDLEMLNQANKLEGMLRKAGCISKL